MHSFLHGFRGKPLKEIKISLYYQQQKKRMSGTLDSGNIRFMRIFARVPRRGGVSRVLESVERQSGTTGSNLVSNTKHKCWPYFLRFRLCSVRL